PRRPLRRIVPTRAAGVGRAARPRARLHPQGRRGGCAPGRRRRRRTRRIAARLLRAADDLRRRAARHDHRPGGDLRAGAVDHPLRHRGGGGPHRQRHRVRPGRGGVVGRPGAGRAGGPPAAHRPGRRQRRPLQPHGPLRRLQAVGGGAGAGPLRPGGVPRGEVAAALSRARRLAAGGDPDYPGVMDSQSVVVITGASAGVGRAAARAFAQHGVRRIGLLARGRAGLDATTRELADLGVQVCAVECDVADAPAVDAAASRIEEELGPIEVWVNNAMTAVFARVADTTAEEFRRVTEVTYLGFVHGTLAALQRMLPRDRGVVVQVGSALAYRGIPLQASYCGAKHAMVGFTESLRTELLHDHSGVQVTMVHLPAMNTPQFSWVRTRLRRHPQPVPPIYQPEVAAEAIVYAASHPRRREHFVGMPTVITVLGNKLLPALGDRYLARSGIDSQ